MLTFSRDPSSPFWRDFIDQYWEKAPVQMVAGPPQSPLTLDDLFSAVVSKPELGPSDRFWLARSSPTRSMADFARIDLKLMGPQPSDGGFDAFFNRMAAHSYGINMHRLHEGNAAFAELADDIATAMAPATRPPVMRWMSDTFFGNYPATPFGIHRDAAGVLSFTLYGTRTYYTWPPEAFDEDDPDLGTPDPDVLARHLPHAERFDVGPGSMVYWPSNRWHLVASPGEPFVVAQVSAYFRPEDVGHD